MQITPIFFSTISHVSASSLAAKQLVFEVDGEEFEI